MEVEDLLLRVGRSGEYLGHHGPGHLDALRKGIRLAVVRESPEQNLCAASLYDVGAGTRHLGHAPGPVEEVVLFKVGV
jgi:hypothetical protein